MFKSFIGNTHKIWFIRNFSNHTVGNLPKHNFENNSFPQFLAHATYNPAELENLPEVTIQPKTLSDKFAQFSVKAFTYPFEDLKKVFANMGPETEKKVFRRLILFESLAVTPAMIAANYLHFKGVRSSKNYGDWINTLLGEAENEKIHLMTFLELYKPTFKNRLEAKIYHYLYRLYFATLYRISPRIAHKVIGYKILYKNFTCY